MEESKKPVDPIESVDPVDEETLLSEEEAEEKEKFEEELKEHFDKVIAKNEKKMEKAEEDDKTFEEEVKEHYDEVIAHSEKKMEKAKNKKKLKGWQIALIVIGAIIVAAGIGVGLFFLIGTLTYKEYVPVDVELDSARPNVATTYTAEEQQKIDLALADNATEDQIKEAIALIYAKANANKIAANQAIAIARGAGTASLEVDVPLIGKVKPDGGMAVRGFKVQSGDAFYYQKGAKVTDCSIKAAKSIVANALNQQERTYASGTGVYKTVQLKGSDAKVGADESATLPYFTVGSPSSINTCDDRDDFLKDAYYLDDPRELSNFRITKETIVLKPLAEGEKYISFDETKKYYTMKFSLLIEGEGHDACVEVARQYLRDSSGSDNLEYGKYDLTFEVWDNGYAKLMHDDEIWEGEMNLGSKSTTSSNSWYECVFYYDFDASLFSEADAAKYQGDDWAKKIIDDYAAALN